ncbi:MAG: AAA family ATPase [Mariniblastus sp.]|nr:AAA family ATPase [Mariniblastus sp.]
MNQRLKPDPPYLRGMQFRDDEYERPPRFPFNLPWLKDFQLNFDSWVTFFVGENGSGKSTLIEAIATLSGLPISGGGRQDMASVFGPEKHSELAKELAPVFLKRPRDGYFFRAEYYAQYASLLDQRDEDPDFSDNPYRAYGGRSLHTRSHGESFLELMQNRFHEGLFLLDEPESALSPQRQLTLLALIADRIKNGKSQFIIATHSPILLTFPTATILNFDESPLAPIELGETSHFQITQGILEHPQRYWKHLAPAVKIDRPAR